MTTAAVVLAAGAGTRFAGPGHKLLAPLAGRRVVDHVLAAVAAAGFDAVFLVVGAVEVGAPAGVVVVRNERWPEGLATSLRAGIAAAAADGHDAVVVGLADQPGVTTEAWRAVGTATSTPIAVATYDGVRGHPVRLAAEVWSQLPASGETGARALLRGGDVPVTEIRCGGSAADVDTVEDLTAWS